MRADLVLTPSALVNTGWRLDDLLVDWKSHIGSDTIMSVRTAAGRRNPCRWWHGNTVDPGAVGAPGSTVAVTGDVTASEDLTLDGQVTGTIELTEHVLSIGATGRKSVRRSATSSRFALRSLRQILPRHGQEPSSAE